MAVRRLSQAELDSDPTEEWRDIPGYLGYRVSNKGRVVSVVKSGGRRRSRTFDNVLKLLRPVINKRGYHVYRLYYESGKPRIVTVHRLVLFAFVGPCPEGMEACHRDDVPGNNRLDNLRWDTRSSNTHDSHRNGRRPVGSAHPLAKLSEADVRAIRRLRAGGAKLRDLEAQFGVHKKTVGCLCAGKTWRHVPFDPPAEASA